MSRIFDKFWVLSIIFTVGFVVLGYLAYTTHEKQIEYYKANRIDDLNETYKSVFVGYEDLSQVVFNNIINKPEIMKKLKEGMTTQNPQARQELFEFFKKDYMILKEKGLKQLHFHTATGHSYLRMHQPEKFGDPLANVRPTIHIANSEKRYVSGFEEGRIYNGFRFVFPLFFEGSHFGSVETSIAASAILSQMERVHHDNYRFFLDKEYMQKRVWKDFLSNYRETKISPALVVEKEVIPNPELQALNAKLSQRVQSLFALKKPFVVCDTINNKDYVVTFFPLKNFANTQVGWFAQYSIDSTCESMTKELTQKFMLLVVMYSVFMMILWYLEKEIRKRRLAQEAMNQLNMTLEEKVATQIHELRQKDMALMTQSRHAVMGEMIGAIAHQWRQPINALSLLVQDVRDAYEYGEVDKEYIEQFVEDSLEQLSHMNNTINDFRNYFKGTEQQHVVPLSKPINEVIRLVEKQFSSHGLVVSKHIIDDTHVKIHEGQTRQVLLNLLSNARDQILAKAPSIRSIEIVLKKEENHAMLCVQDHAGGVPLEIMDKIFDSYFSTKGEHGTGVGLYMSKMIVEEQLKGTLTVHNTDDGAMFVMTLPLAD